MRPLPGAQPRRSRPTTSDQHPEYERGGWVVIPQPLRPFPNRPTGGIHDTALGLSGSEKRARTGEESQVDLTATLINLSYVLHEPSTSDQVRGAARRLVETEPGLRRAVAALASLPDPDLRERVVIHAPGGLPDVASDEPLVALSLQIGAWPLLPRVLALLGRPGTGAQRPPWRVWLLDDPGSRSSQRFDLFRAPARLCVPDTALMLEWFAVLVLRPGSNTLLLAVERLAESECGPNETTARLRRAIPAAETAIRSHVGQWLCPVPLWEKPAEDYLPEFRPG